MAQGCSGQCRLVTAQRRLSTRFVELYVAATLPFWVSVRGWAVGCISNNWRCSVVLPLAGHACMDGLSRWLCSMGRLKGDRSLCTTNKLAALTPWERCTVVTSDLIVKFIVVVLVAAVRVQMPWCAFGRCSVSM
jgi:hypothetical protein